MVNEVNILLTSAGRRTYMVQYFKQALNGSGKVYASNSEYTATLREADGYVITPLIYDVLYIDFLLNYCKEKQISAILPLLDMDLSKLSENEKRFESIGVKLIVSSPSVIHICNDKWSMSNWFLRMGISQPKTFLYCEDALDAIEQGIITYPLIVKPRWGMASIGVYKVDMKEELIVLFNKVKRICKDTYLKYESAADFNNCVLIQEMILGSEFGMNVLNDLDANYVSHAVIQKVSMRAGETDIAITVQSDQFKPLAILLSENLRHIGNLDVDIIKSSSGKIYVIELNARFGGQYPFIHNAGADYPRQIVNWLLKKSTDIKYLMPEVNVKSCKELVMRKM